jgi:hypothetical protein
MRSLHPGDAVRWQGFDGVVLRAIEVDDGYVYEIDLNNGRIAFALEREITRAT